MSHSTCPFCKREGLVRHERVIKGTHSHTEHYCGACLRTWWTGHDGQHIGGSIRSVQDMTFKEHSRKDG